MRTNGDFIEVDCFQRNKGNNIVCGRRSDGADEGMDVGGICCRSKHNLSDARQGGSYLRHFVAEAQFETLVELVYHQHSHVLSVDVSFPQMVKQTARCGKQDLRVYFAQLTVLVHGGAAAVAAKRAQRHLHPPEIGFALCGQLARGDDDNGLQ